MASRAVGEVAALLLAAGESTRMGELKALLPWRGKTLIEHQVIALAAGGLSHIIVVLGHQAERLEPLLKRRRKVLWVHNPDHHLGKTTSIRAGLRVLQHLQDSIADTSRVKAILVLNVDQPRSAVIIRKILERHFHATEDERSKQPPLITIPTYHGQGGHPVVLSTSLMTDLMDMHEETLGLKAVVRMHERETQRVEMSSPEVLIDLNTPQDYQSALETLAPLG